MGGRVAVGQDASAHSLATLRLPAASDSSSSGAALPSYNMAHAPSQLPVPVGSTGTAALAAGGASSDCGPLRRASLQSTGNSRLAAQQPADDLLLCFGDNDRGSDDNLADVLFLCGFDNSFAGGFGSAGSSALMPPIPALRSGICSAASLSALCLPSLPQSLASIPAKATGVADEASPLP